MVNTKRKIIAIVGPTASGKTGIGVRLAKEFDGEIISADSRQVYRGLDLGTGKEGTPCGARGISNSKFLISNQIPNIQLKNDQNFQRHPELVEGSHHHVSGTEMTKKLRSSLRYIEGIPQWMIDIVDPEEKMTLFDYLPLARLAIEDILSRGKLPIIVGGTGLYVQGIVEGFQLEKSSRVNGNEACIGNGNRPASDETGIVTLTAKRYAREQLNNLAIDQLNQILRGVDAEKYEKVDQKNKHRLIRAIELAQEGLKPTKIKPDFEVLQIGVDIPRKELHERIDRRVDERFNQGMLEEVFELLMRGVDPEWLIGLGLEYREITQFLISNYSNKIPISQTLNGHNFQCHSELAEESHHRVSGSNKLQDKILNTKYLIHDSEFQAMSQRLKFRIHQFARRQLTWFRRFPEINWLFNYNETKRFVKIFLEH